MMRHMTIELYKVQESHFSEKQATLEAERVLILLILISNLTSEHIHHIHSLLP
jgi:hypothetical protein